MKLRALYAAGVAAAGLALSLWAQADAAPNLGIGLYAGIRITGVPGSVHVVQASRDAGGGDGWRSLAFVRLDATNQLYVDTENPADGRRFYRSVLQLAPTNLVFIPAGTFRMGSPTNDPGRGNNEGPQTAVTLTRGFWMGRFEVTQAEYLSVMGTNPSVFPGDLTRPISSVSWLDATNYCHRLTELELAAGQIPAGTRYRLPTEAEWEYAARAGTTTQYSFGDDPDHAEVSDYAWHLSNAGLTVHPVGQKRPNPWGLHDMYGNVWEWCLDWYGPLPGGFQVDPTGPTNNVGGWKVMRGGAYDYPETSCRSASRLFFGLSPFLTDSDLGFRVVLACE